MQKRDQAVLAALVIGLLVGAAATYALAAAGLSRTTTTTTTLAPITITSTMTVTASQQSQAVANVASNGLRLSTFINATVITVGQSLNISISLFNTLGTSNTPNTFGPAGDNWTFYGVPVVTWPECSLAPHQVRQGFEFPIEVLVLDGNYTSQQLASLANDSLPAFPCTPGVVVIPIYTFGPESDLVNITYYADGGVGLGPSQGVFPSTSNFTPGGYWNFTSLKEQANGAYISEPALCQLCKIPSSSPFVPGVYTIGVSDEWGQYNVIHFQVSASG
jgi:hypothetical protein